MKKSALMLLALSAVFLIFLFGCLGQADSRPATTGSQKSSEIQTAPQVKVFSINETMTVNDTSFRVTAWGFAPYWGSTRPKQGGKFIWMNVIASNVGTTPIDLPNDFGVSYRGTPARLVTPMGHASTYAVYTHCYNPCPVYPGVSKEGYLLFEVPSGLQDGEAVFSAYIKGEQYDANLSNPVPFEGRHVSFIGANLKCAPSQYTGSFFCNDVNLVVFNDKHFPFMHEGGKILILSNVSISGQPSRSTAMMHIYNLGLRPLGKKNVTYGISPIGFVDERKEYVLNNTSIGKPGESVPIDFTVTHSEKGKADVITQQRVNAILPQPT